MRLQDGRVLLSGSADGKERWWLEVTGLGEKTRPVPATDELMAELLRYRKALGLKPLPADGENTPLVLPLIGATKPMARSAGMLVGIVAAIDDRRVKRRWDSWRRTYSEPHAYGVRCRSAGEP